MVVLPPSLIYHSGLEIYKIVVVLKPSLIYHSGLKQDIILIYHGELKQNKILDISQWAKIRQYPLYVTVS